MATVTGKLDSLTTTLQIDSAFIDDVDLRLQSLGYQIQDSDPWMIGFSIQKVMNHIKNECNISIVPDELKQIAIDMVCGEFLFAKKGSGQLQGFELDLEVAVKQIQEGDTNIVFAVDSSMTPEQRLNKLISFLLSDKKGQFAAFRRLKW